MAIRRGLLTLLAREPMHGYQLRSEFDAATGATWPLNIGQVYTTLSRLERDGFVQPIGESDGRVTYEITDAGRDEVKAWFDAPVAREGRPRDELAIKLALALTAPGVDVPKVVQIQRTATVRSLQDLTKLKASADPVADAAWLLVLEAMIFQAEAEVRWLDHCESRLARHRPQHATVPAPARGMKRLGVRR
jgi:DNA-binding PadR family transcriptional regulator